MRRLSRWFAQKSRRFQLVTFTVLLAAVGIADTVTNVELVLSLFYILPVAVSARHLGRSAGYAFAAAAAMTWLGSDLLSAHLQSYVFTHPGIPYWNAAMRLGMFLLVARLIAALQDSTEHYEELARTDFLTGIANSRSFYELCANELRKSRRYDRPVSLAYLDLDNFKKVNDRHGHQAGDDLLRVVATTMRQTVRRTDIAARVGGDEFVVLLPETGIEDARTVIGKLQANLRDEMKTRKHDVSLSIGVVTFLRPPESVDAVVARADDLMFAVKRNGKNSVGYEILEGDAPAVPSVGGDGAASPPPGVT